MTEADGVGGRIRQLILDRASQISRRYTDREFITEVGMVERGKKYSPSALVEWTSGRNELGRQTALAMEAVLERHGAACYIMFGVWPRNEAGEIIATPGAVRAARAPLPDPRQRRPAAKVVAAGGGSRAKKRPRKR